jgi:hypothetical protein
MYTVVGGKEVREGLRDLKEIRRSVEIAKRGRNERVTLGSGRPNAYFIWS